MHLGDVTGSLEVGKSADLILIDISPVHNSPRFHHDPNSTYAQVVYATKATDVTDVMVHGRWLMRNQQLLTVQEGELLKAAGEYAIKIDTFLIKREKSLLSKLLALGERTEEEESFEVQAKVPVKDPQIVLTALINPEIQIIRTRHYRQYDVYFGFDAPEESHLRYREDHSVSKQGVITNVRTRLTLIGPSREHSYPKKVLLSRSRFLASANQSLRFYREYFKPTQEIEIEKDRLRYLVKFKDTEFFINLDTMNKPDLGYFLEIKSRTWSQKDAELKSQLVVELIKQIGESPEATISQDYIGLIKA